MNNMTTPIAPHRFRRALELATFNWPLYLLAGLGLLGGIGLASVASLPPAARWIGGGVAVLSAWYACASFLAFHWMFDRSRLLDWRWLREEFNTPPAHFVAITAGVEIAAIAWHEIFPNSHVEALDIFDPRVMPASAIARAHQSTGRAANACSLPVASGSVDAVFVVLAAHEIRDQDRRVVFFHELARITSPTGQCLLIEHPRTIWSALAFGPGHWHFYPRSVWQQLAQETGWAIVRQRSFSPFVDAYVLQRAPKN